MLAMDSATGLALYVASIRSETNADYVAALRSVEERGYVVRGLVVDGRKGLFEAFSGYEMQMCQFHMAQIVRRYLTRNPRLGAARALNAQVDTLATSDREAFEKAYGEWRAEWGDTIRRRTVQKSGKTRYTHKRLRSAMHSLDFYLPHLFTYQKPSCEGMPNTNNKIEGGVH